MPGNSTKIENLEFQWIDHSTIKIKSPEIILYIDPWSKVLKGNEEKADIILISHSHFDHLDLEAIKNLSKENTQIVCDKLSSQKILQKNVKVLSEKDNYEFKGINILPVPSYNITKQFHPRGFSIGFVIEFENLRIYYAGDTDLIREMTSLGKINVAILPIGGKYTMDQKEAVDAVKLINPEFIIPVHYNFLDETKANPEIFKKEIEKTTRTQVILL